MKRTSLMVNIPDLISSKFMWNDLMTSSIATALRSYASANDSTELVVARDELRKVYGYLKKSSNKPAFDFGSFLYRLSTYIDKGRFLKHSQFNIGKVDNFIWANGTMTSALDFFQEVLYILSGAKKYVKCLHKRDVGHNKSRWLAKHEVNIVIGGVYPYTYINAETGTIGVWDTDDMPGGKRHAYGVPWHLPFANFAIVGA